MYPGRVGIRRAWWKGTDAAQAARGIPPQTQVYMEIKHQARQLYKMELQGESKEKAFLYLGRVEKAFRGSGLKEVRASEGGGTRCLNVPTKGRGQGWRGAPRLAQEVHRLPLRQGNEETGSTRAAGGAQAVPKPVGWVTLKSQWPMKERPTTLGAGHLRDQSWALRCAYVTWRSEDYQSPEEAA